MPNCPGYNCKRTSKKSSSSTKSKNGNKLADWKEITWIKEKKSPYWRKKLLDYINN